MVNFSSRVLNTTHIELKVPTDWESHGEYFNLKFNVTAYNVFQRQGTMANPVPFQLEVDDNRRNASFDVKFKTSDCAGETYTLAENKQAKLMLNYQEISQKLYDMDTVKAWFVHNASKGCPPSFYDIRSAEGTPMPDETIFIITEEQGLVVDLPKMNSTFNLRAQGVYVNFMLRILANHRNTNESLTFPEIYKEVNLTVVFFNCTPIQVIPTQPLISLNFDVDLEKNSHEVLSAIWFEPEHHYCPVT